MRRSKYFLPILKETPAEAKIVSHRLMLRAGLIRQASAGIYVWLPLGLRVMHKIAAIVRAEQARMGAIEMLMPTIQDAQLWRVSGRYDNYGEEMLRITDRHKTQLLYGPTNEEQITQLVCDTVHSYRDLPLLLYHIQWKFRDEIRPRFGVLRGREFLMKDSYSFDIDKAGAMRAYDKMFVAYLRSFARMGLKAVPVAADSGPIGGERSHEFVVLTETGESQIYCHKSLLDLPMPDAELAEQELPGVIEAFTQFYAASDEKYDKTEFEKQVPAKDRLITRGIEVGHIFYFGEKYSKPMACRLQDAQGQERLLHCGSYGIGVSRLVGAAIEASHDAQGIIWPPSLAPFHFGLVCLRPADAASASACEELYRSAQAQGLEVLYDDRDERAGHKFADMELIGLPWQITIGPKEAENAVVELKTRATGERQQMPAKAALAHIQKGLTI